MSRDITAFWHKESFERLMKDRLPQLLAARVPLSGYHFESTGPYTCRIKIAFASASNNIEVTYTDLPQPDAEGVFEIDGEHRVVIPVATDENLEAAEIKCVGEQLYDDFEARLGGAPPSLPWDASLVRAWLPLDTWVWEFLRATAQTLQENNWLDKYCHLRRVRVLWQNRVYNPGHFGRVCSFETPEGPNIGRILSIAVGAAIRDGRLIIADNGPEAILGLTATMVPFIEHNDPNRQLMGVNMMRQCYVPPQPEPAFVQTGNEPDVPGFWYGRNVLTAFVSWGAGTFEDAILISESCAKRFNYPYPVEPGDKFANRHGTKGCISRILPDDEMPHLPDGTPVELVYSFIGLQTRLNFGQIREALMSRLARAEGEPAVVPPFRAPSERELRERLKKAVLPEDGMEVLTLGKNGKKLESPSVVGWVYWGRLYHIAREKIHASVHPQAQAQRLDNPEYEVLRNLAAFETLKERLDTCSVERTDAPTLADRVASGPIQQAEPPSPQFSKLAGRLAIAGIHAELAGEKLRFRFAPPEGKVLKLARPIPHPWLRSQTLEAVGVIDKIPEYQPLAAVNARVERMLASDTPESLTRQTLNQLQTRVREYLDALVNPELLRFHTRSLFSGRAVIEPEIRLRLDEVGIPEEMAWTLFGPLVTREIGNAEAVQTRNREAAQALDAMMAQSWVILYRSPALMPTSFLAFHPVRYPDNAVHLPPMVCPLLNADFDGDQAAIFLPLAAAAQREAGEILSVAGHLARDSELLGALLPYNEPMWGLAYLSLTPEGRVEISTLAGIDIPAPDGYITRNALADAMEVILKRDGVDQTLERLEKLVKRGFEVSRESGASMSPFIGDSLERTPPPEDNDAPAWDAYTEEMIEGMASRRTFNDTDLGTQLLSVKSGAKGSLHGLSQIVVRWNNTLSSAALAESTAAAESPPTVHHGYRDGLTSDELRVIVPYHWEGLARLARQLGQFGQDVGNVGKNFNVLGRAMQAKRPGIVFARAAAIGEVDGLVDVDSRIFVGLAVTARH